MTRTTNARVAGFTFWLYWLWRIRIRKTLLGIVSISTPQVSGATK
jgi:hypothetical protein